GDIAVIDKFTRARLAVRSGIDLVIELPVAYCLSPAENFAKGAVYLLESLGCIDEISFGSECGDIDKLVSAMNKADEILQLESVKMLMKNGYTYPSAVSRILKETDTGTADVISQPNNILALEYLRALKYLKSDIKPFTVKRTGVSHDSKETSQEFASASYIRENISSAKNFVPEIWADALESGVAILKNLEKMILYRIRTVSDEDLFNTNDMTGGLFDRIYGNQANSLNELFESVKTKCYTMARIKRVILSLLTGVRKTDIAELPPYARVIAFNKRGRDILSVTKKTKKIPVGMSLAKLGRLNCTAQRFAELESMATDIYGLALDKIPPAGEDYRAKIVISQE
ncbi:MAG: nucleotidyltransferase family protein, partial [Ruminococcus sp.]|nr:nucleotidyltransferase family protein [Ruminococcus sp.]